MPHNSNCFEENVFSTAISGFLFKNYLGLLYNIKTNKKWKRSKKLKNLIKYKNIQMWRKSQNILKKFKYVEKW